MIDNCQLSYGTLYELDTGSARLCMHVYHVEVAESNGVCQTQRDGFGFFRWEK